MLSLSFTYIYYHFRLFFILLLIFAVAISPAGDHYSKTVNLFHLFFGLLNVLCMVIVWNTLVLTKDYLQLKNVSLLTVCMKSSYMSWRTNLVLKVGGGILDIRVYSSIIVLVREVLTQKWCLLMLQNRTSCFWTKFLFFFIYILM